VAIQTDPDVLILLPVGLKERIYISLGMIGSLPLFIDFFMAHPAVLSLNPWNTHRNLLVRDRMSKIIP
jgi:hypothetical protein